MKINKIEARPGAPGNTLTIALMVSCATVLLLGNVHAAEWSLGPEIKAGGRYDDNPRLREAGDPDEISGGYLDLALVAERRTEISSLRVRPRVYLDRYDDSTEDSDDQYLDLSWRTEGQRSDFWLKANVSNQQVRRGEVSNVEFPDSDLDEVDEGTTGRIVDRRERLRWRVRPEYAYEISQRTSLGVAAEYADVDYDNEQPGEALDYTDSTVELFVDRQLTQKSRLRASLFGSRYESDDISNESDSYGLGLRYERDISETFSWYTALGAQSTDVVAGDMNQVDESQSNFLFSLGGFRQWERTRLQAEISRSVDPSGTGFLKTRDGVRINLRHQFRPRWYGEIGAYAFVEDSVDEAVEVNDRDYARSRLKLGWQASPAWSIEIVYEYTHQDYDDTPGTANANEIALGFVYRPTRNVWSR